MSLSKNECPVPFDQQPLNEYLSLKKSWPFNWSTYKIQKYVYTILLIFVTLFISLGLLIFSIYFKKIGFWKLCFLDILIIDIILFSLLLRLYLGWSYVIKRLLSATVFYEESGWYDGQIWIKTSDSLIQDRLIGLYQILPLINRIKYSCWILILNTAINYAIYYLL
uniref:Ycf36 n=1 Tax=Plumaria plumosa TaxID=189642 RepID=A0A4D6X034_9FLOR|nr:hypothetical protein [Plumaria plumosa]